MQNPFYQSDTVTIETNHESGEWLPNRKRPTARRVQVLIKPINICPIAFPNDIGAICDIRNPQSDSAFELEENLRCSV